MARQIFIKREEILNRKADNATNTTDASSIAKANPVYLVRCKQFITIQL